MAQNMYMLHSWNRLSRALGAGILAAGLLAGAARGAEIAHWSFDTQNPDGTFPDAVGNAHPATPKDNSAIVFYSGSVPAPFGKAITLTGGPGAYLTIPPLTGIQKNSFTVAAWAYFTTPGPNFILADWQSMTQAGFVFGVNPLGPDKSTAQPIADLASTETNTRNRNRLSVVRQPLPTKSVTLGEWHHMTWTWDRENALLTTYLDGEPLGEMKKPTSSAFSKTLDLAVNSRPMRIGSQEQAVGGASPAFHGSLDELWIFDQALTRLQIRNLKDFNDIRGNTAPPMAMVNKPPTPPPTSPDNGTPAATDRGGVTPNESEHTMGSRVLGSTSGRLSPARVVGIVMGLVVIVTMACYLIWAVTERGKLRAAGRLT